MFGKSVINSANTKIIPNAVNFWRGKAQKGKCKDCSNWVWRRRNYYSKKVQALKLEQDVLFLGACSDVPALLSMMDVFCQVSSIIGHENNENNYDILILHRDISEQNQRKLIDMISDNKNFSMRFIDVTVRYQDK